VNVALLVKRYLLVVPAQYHAHLPLARPFVPYSPTYVELAVTLGSYAFAGLLFVGLLKLVPIVELPGEDAMPAWKREGRSPLRITILTVSLLAGIALIAWGILAREQEFAPLKWLLGLALCVALPLERCLIRGRPVKEPGERTLTERDPVAERKGARP
jgi:hypothetical protein